MIFKVLTVVIMKKTVSWDVKPDKSLVKVADPSKMTVHIYQTIRCYIQEDGCLLNSGEGWGGGKSHHSNCFKLHKDMM